MRFHSLFNVRVIIRLKYETSSYLVIYYNIFQFFLQKRYSEADFFMKVAWKIALYNLAFHQLPLIQHCSIFYKKNAFQSTKFFLRRIQWQNMLRMHLLQSRISKFWLSPTLFSVNSQFSPYFINWDSYFNSFWEPWDIVMYYFL